MAKKNSSSWRSRLNIFANSPRFVKLFGPLVILLMVGAIGYGGYTLISERYSDAGFKNMTWRLNGSGIGHHGGRAAKYTIGGSSSGNLKLDLKNGITNNQDGTQRNVWAAGPLDANQLVWWGPYIDLKPGQYMGCIYYAFQKAGGGKAMFDVTNNFGNTKLRELTLYNDPLGSNFRFPREDNKFSRTCMAFYVPKYMKNNTIELRVRHLSGTMFIRQTQIVKLTSKNSKVSNTKLFKKFPDNRSILHNWGYTK